MYTNQQKSRRNKQTTIIVGLLVLSIILMAVAFTYTNTKAAHDKEYLSLAAEQRVLALQIVKYASEASRAKAGAFSLLLNSKNQFETSLGLLINGNPQTGLPPSPHEVAAELSAVSNQWPAFSGNIDTILKTEGVIRMLSKFVLAINDVVPELLTRSDQLTERLIKLNANAKVIRLASRQLLLGQRIAHSANQVLQGGLKASDAADEFRDDTKEFEQTLTSLLNGNNEQNIPRIDDKQTRKQLKELDALFETVQELLIRLLERSNQLFSAQAAANEIFLAVEPLQLASTNLVKSYASLEKRRNKYNITAYGLGGISLVLLILLGNTLMKNTRQQLQEEEQTNQRTQKAILRLLNEIHPLAEGDLTVQATVSEEITGAIADAINYSIEALRQLVTSINQMSRDVSLAAEETQATAILLTRTSEHQTGQITEVTRSVDNMAKAIEQVSQNAKESADVANQSVEIANQGVLAVLNTIQGMNVLREHIRDTSSRIKRLGESSQEIGDIIELINDIADQTNILALNAAIQATAAGDAGLGFATVADEVQQLAERVSQATGKIESLIHGIQLDTSRAVVSMEQSTTDVIEGAKIAENAGDALIRIEAVSASLADLINGISATATQLSETAHSISANMNAIQRLTTQNLAGTKQTADLTGKLTTLAEEQITAVSGFKLPAANDSSNE